MKLVLLAVVFGLAAAGFGPITLGYGDCHAYQDEETARTICLVEAIDDHCTANVYYGLWADPNNLYGYVELEPGTLYAEAWDVPRMECVAPDELIVSSTVKRSPWTFLPFVVRGGEE